MTSTQQHSPRPADFHIVDLFAGPGGLDVAADVLGVSTVGIEFDANACATRKLAGLSTVQGDVRSSDPIHFPSANVLTGGPPCQTFTVAGNGAGRRALDDVLKFVQRVVDRDAPQNIDLDLSEMEDERTGLVLEPLRWALKAIDDERLSPYEAIILEQVPAVLPVWEEYAKALFNEGYWATTGMLRTEQFGVPQTRRRAVLIACRRDGLTGLSEEAVELPKATHQPYRKGEERWPFGSKPEPWVTMGDVLPHRPKPFKVVSNYGTGGDPKARGERYSYHPAATVTGKISRNRVVKDGIDLERFSASEAGLLQSFPAAYPWAGGDISQQIGNAVPPKLALHILSTALGFGAPTKATLEKLASWQPPV
ncbi:DNA cytosine methyltransferase [Streptomyces sp. HUAS MG91]|uniref:DNA (cytosine-5-)-methyltransferase n=1 Tax=Streptomyces tabacisoli TaxID=3156398 RepID=A0AAU8ISY6_9ACTN